MPSSVIPAHPTAPLAALLWPAARPANLPLFQTPGLELTLNARGALYLACSEVADHRRTKILLPAFHCPSAITPALAAGLQPVYYRIKPDLSIDLDDVLAKADAQTAAVLIIHFFGIAPDLQALGALASQGIKIIEDCSHSFLQASVPLRLAGSPASDFRIFSFWKIVPSGVGGGLLRRQPPQQTASAPQLRSTPWSVSLKNYKLLLEESVEKSDMAWAKLALNGLERVRKSVRPATSNKPTAQTLHQSDRQVALLENGEAYYPFHQERANCRIPPHVQRILLAADLAQIVNARRANFLAFAAHQSDLSPMRALRLGLAPDDCPWVYPVLLQGRSALDHKLRAAGVSLHTFGIYLHSTLFKSGHQTAIADAVQLARRTLCLAVHQDLTVADIERSCQTIRSTLRQFAPVCP